MASCAAKAHIVPGDMRIGQATCVAGNLNPGALSNLLHSPWLQSEDWWLCTNNDSMYVHTHVVL